MTTATIQRKATVAHQDCTVEIRPAVRADLSDIAKLEKKVYQIEGPWSLAMFKSDFAGNDRHYLVAHCDDELVGYAAASNDNHVAEILMLTVSESHRGRGIARSFMDQLISWCSDQGATDLELQVRDGNDAAIALYEDYGFTRTGTLTDYYGKAVNAHEMHLPLLG